MAKYVVTRRDICAGRLIKPIGMSYKMYDINKVEISKEKLAEQGITNISVFGGLICRGMLFNVNESGLANDLIYTTPTNYPIEGIQSKTNVKSEFIIQDYVELEELLKYLKYGVDLTQKDLNQIYRKLITSGWWLNNHMDLFGWQKNKYGYNSGGNQIIPMSIYDNLSNICLIGNGKPHKEEPEYKLIKKKR